MANSTDPFGKSMFSSSSSGGPGMTSLPTPTAATKKTTNPYQYAGAAGYQDPLAQELYQKYNPGITRSQGQWGSNWDQLMKLSQGYASQPGGGGNYIDPLNPRNWGAGAMKDEYLARGGLGTYEQQAQYPGATNWPTDASGNPLPRMNPQTGALESPGPTGATAAVSRGSGSTNALAPNILSKMWR
jgi:hypothetical protein